MSWKLSAARCDSIMYKALQLVFYKISFYYYLDVKRSTALWYVLNKLISWVRTTIYWPKHFFFSWKQAFCKIPLYRQRIFFLYLNLLRLTAFLSVNREVIRYFLKQKITFFVYHWNMLRWKCFFKKYMETLWRWTWIKSLKVKPS